MHLAFSAGLCGLFCGNDGLDGERKAIRHATIVENLQQLYTDVFSDWIVANEQAEELRWRAVAIDRYLKLRLRGHNSTSWTRSPHSATGRYRIRKRRPSSPKAWKKRRSPNLQRIPLQRIWSAIWLLPNFVRSNPPSHSALIEQRLYNPRGGAREREESDRVGKLLRASGRDGEKGKLFDGVSNIRIDGRVAHFELGQIPEHATEMRAATNFLVANYGRQKIIAVPRAVPKIAIFEEAARTLEIPGGVRMIQEYKYT